LRQKEPDGLLLTEWFQAALKFCTLPARRLARDTPSLVYFSQTLVLLWSSHVKARGYSTAKPKTFPNHIQPMLRILIKEGEVYVQT